MTTVPKAKVGRPRKQTLDWSHPADSDPAHTGDTSSANKTVVNAGPQGNTVNKPPDPPPPNVVTTRCGRAVRHPVKWADQMK